jgi:hypothetical protein
MHYIAPDHRHQVVCIQCWRRLTEAIDGGAYQAEQGGPLPLWSDQWRVGHGIAPDVPCPLTRAGLRSQRTTREGRASGCCGPANPFMKVAEMLSPPLRLKDGEAR